jgi:hypothetical protein
MANVANFTQIFGFDSLVTQAQWGLNAVCFATMSTNRADEGESFSVRADQFSMNAISCVRKRTMRLLQCVQGGTYARAR